MQGQKMINALLVNILKLNTALLIHTKTFVIV